MQSKGISHVLIVRSTLERRLDAKFPTLFKYHVVEVPEGPTENLILFFTGLFRLFAIMRKGLTSFRLHYRVQPLHKSS
jgi:hypothetical protein